MYRKQSWRGQRKKIAAGCQKIAAGTNAPSWAAPSWAARQFPSLLTAASWRARQQLRRRAAAVVCRNMAGGMGGWVCVWERDRERVCEVRACEVRARFMQLYTPRERREREPMGVGRGNHTQEREGRRKTFPHHLYQPLSLIGSTKRCLGSAGRRKGSGACTHRAGHVWGPWGVSCFPPPPPFEL